MGSDAKTANTWLCVGKYIDMPEEKNLVFKLTRYEKINFINIH